MKLFVNSIIMLLSFIFCSNYFAQTDIKINFDSLLQKSDAIVLDDQIEVNIEDNLGAKVFISKKILVKNKIGDKHCRITLSESHFLEVDDLEGRITDDEGNEIKELDSDDIREAEYSGDDFYNGKKYKFFEFTHTTYPFILEFKYRIDFKTLLLWPDWYPQDEIPTLHSSYKLNINPSVKFRKYAKSFSKEAFLTHTDEFDTYIWELTNIPSFTDEEFLPPSDRIQIALYFIPEKFSTDSYEGNTTSWNDYADWYRKLAAGRYELPNEAKNEIQDLVKDLPNKKEKIKSLYKYLQKKNRYVAIEMGLAGWQPQSAEQVYTNRYGDCKDLSTFMVAILDAAGIKSYPALTLTKNRGDVIPDFPSNQFNHCIVMVPMETDSIWLECTSSYDDAGEMYYTIEDMYALVVGDNFGKLIKTPQKKSFQNKWSSVTNASFKLDNLVFNSDLAFTGNQKDVVKNVFESSNNNDDKLFLTRMLSRNYSNLSLDVLKLSDNNVDANDFALNTKGVYKKIITNDAQRIFFNPAIFNRQTALDIPKENPSERKYPVYYKYPFLDVDSAFIDLPRQYTLEAKPQNQNIENDFVGYKSEFDLKDGRLFYYRSFERKKNRIELTEYPEFYNAMKQIIEFDKAKFVLKKN